MRSLRTLNRPGWLNASELRIGLGCMRMSTDETLDEELALETIAAAAEAGVTVFDTAHAYGRDAEELGHNERLLARALRLCGAERRARIVTKGGMTRTGGGWIPDGRAKAILADCDASLVALDGLPIDLYLIHAPDSRTRWRTSVRALARLVDEGVVRHVGLSNVNRLQLDEALELAPITAVQVALSPLDRALRGGVVERCEELGITVIAHSPLGGPRRADGLGRRRRSPRSPNVTVVMGIPGAGKTRVAEEYVARGYLRLNRDERGGSLREPPTHSTRHCRQARAASSSTTPTSRARHGAT